MQKRHFEIIAATLAQVKPEIVGPSSHAMQAQWEYTVEAFVRACKASNPKFKELTFRNACSQ